MDAGLLGGRNINYQGLLATADLVDPLTVANALNLTAGTRANEDAGWLHFNLDGKTLYVAKKPFRTGLSWNSLNAVDALVGNKTINIGGKVYKIRVLKGIKGTTNVDHNGYDLPITHDSEWNRLMYPITTFIPESQEGPNQANFSITELGLDSTDDGRYNICQETGDASTACTRGTFKVSYSAFSARSDNSGYMGWRPVLELVG